MKRDEAQIRRELAVIQNAYGTYLKPGDTERFVENRMAGVKAANRSVRINILIFSLLGLALGIGLNVCLAKGLLTIEHERVIVTAGRAAASIAIVTVMSAICGAITGNIRYKGRLF